MKNSRQCVREARMSLAIEELAQGTPIKQIAELTGYSDISTFTRAFSVWTGESPARYRKKQRRYTVDKAELIYMVNENNSIDDIEQIVYLARSFSTKYIDEQLVINAMGHDKTHIFACKIGDEVVGMASFCTYMTLYGLRSTIEDVVVKKEYQGRGIGRRLITEILIMAKEMNVNKVELTSNQSRIVANTLYVKLGFQRRETNVYSYKL